MVRVRHNSAVSASLSDAIEEAQRRYGPARLARLAQAPCGHFWHAPRRRLVLDLLLAERVADPQAPLLDVGCADGSLVRELRAVNVEAFGLDPWAERLQLDPERFRCGTVSHIPWPDAAFGTVCAFDLLEHVDDRAALGELGRVLRPGGALLVTVPAHGFLWSPRDEGAGHLRRYTRRGLRRALRAAGLVVERLFGFECLLLPLAVVARAGARALGDRREPDLEDLPPRWLNDALARVNRFELALGSLLRPPTGTSLVAVARRPRRPESPGRAESELR
jgi:SAM-dependent methyltransferase